jgi:hypothetical protein
MIGRRVTALAAVAIIGFTGAACSDEDGDGASTDEEVDQLDENLEDAGDDVQDEVDAGEDEVDDSDDDSTTTTGG